MVAILDLFDEQCKYMTNRVLDPEIIGLFLARVQVKAHGTDILP